MTIYARGRWQEWARVASPQGGAARGGPAPPGGVAPLLLLSLPPSGYFCLLVILGNLPVRCYGIKIHIDMHK
jgi:hypothetical protein